VQLKTTALVHELTAHVWSFDPKATISDTNSTTNTVITQLILSYLRVRPRWLPADRPPLLRALPAFAPPVDGHDPSSLDVEVPRLPAPWDDDPDPADADTTDPRGGRLPVPFHGGILSLLSLLLAGPAGDWANNLNDPNDGERASAPPWGSGLAGFSSQLSPGKLSIRSTNGGGCVTPDSRSTCASPGSSLKLVCEPIYSNAGGNNRIAQTSSAVVNTSAEAFGPLSKFPAANNSVDVKSIALTTTSQGGNAGSGRGPFLDLLPDISLPAWLRWA
jgi:hypothetical protein